MLNSIGLIKVNIQSRAFLLFSFSLVLLIITACNKPKAPDFKRISNVQPKSVSLSAIELTGNAEFFNPNSLNAKVKSFDVDVMVNGSKVGKITEIDKTDIPPNQDISIPFLASINPKELSSGTIGDIINIFSKKVTKLDLHYKGTVVVKAAALSFKIPIDFKDEVTVKL